MRAPRVPHRWTITPSQAIRLQRRLALIVRQEPLQTRVRYVAAGDVAFSHDGTLAVAGWVVWDTDRLAVVDSSSVVQPVRFPYVPGLLSFREAPALVAAARRLRTEPDMLLCDGHGLAHPRRFGLACHLGLLLDRPTAGCAKSLLCGTHDRLPNLVGAEAPLFYDGDVVGAAVRTRLGVRPVFISVGHRITLPEAVAVTLRCLGRYRLPEPALLAHQMVTHRRDAVAKLAPHGSSSTRNRAK